MCLKDNCPASNKDDERRKLWDILRCIRSQNIPAIVIGYGNMIFVEGKKKEERFLVRREVQDFRSFIIKI